MAEYEYRCKACGRVFVKQMSFSEHERHRRPPCPKCHSRKVEQRPNVFQAMTGKKT